jgi:hypothetical protein
MTVALGVTEAAEAPASAIRARPEHLAIISVPEDTARTTRDRLAHQVAFARQLRSFLPFRARHPIDTAHALEYVSAKAENVTAQLHARRHLVQFIVALAKPVNAPGLQEQTWLRRRASETQQLAADTAALAGHFGKIGASNIRLDDRRGFIHLVGDKTLLPRIRSVLGDAARPGEAEDKRQVFAVVTGPWPVFSELDMSGGP